MQPPVEAVYEQRRAAFGAEERRLARISFRFSLLRGGLFFAFALCLIAILAWASSATAGWWVAAGVFLVLFLLALPVHDRVIRDQRRAADLVAINEEALHRIAREWDRVPVPAFEGPETGGSLARDLGLFGRASLFHLLGTAYTPPGKARLASWLLRPAPPEEIAERQAAVAELAPEIETRQQLQVRARPMEKVPPDLEPFLRWAEDLPWLLDRPVLIWFSRLFPLFTVGSLVYWIYRVAEAARPGGAPSAGSGWPFLLAVLVSIAVSYRFQERLAESFDRVEAREDEFQLYAEALTVVVEQPAAAPLLRRIETDLAPQGRTAPEWMALLHKRIVLSDVRHGLIHFFVQVLLLWDFHTLWLLERWQREAGPHVRRWLAALGDFEALSALAGLRHDNPGWAFPVVRGGRQGEDRFAARELGHPLIPQARRVCNDVEVGPPGSFLLVTGSNMSGKSTLLRAIGVNAVLAQAGGPACAAALRLPPVELATSILIEDSLVDGVSFFMAELQRVKGIVEEADRCHAGGRALLYLLDEILRGTNSEERQVAVRRVILHLLHQGAIGAVSTHDLGIAEIEELRAAARPVHFRETVHPRGDGPPMTFDYRMRPGVATTTNALKLMELVGLTPE